MNHRQVPAAGIRPRAHPSRPRRRCVICGRRYSLDLRRQPWARATTCSPTCRARKGNRGRHAGNCSHCVVVELYRLARDTDLHEVEVAAGDERPLLTFRDFLRGYRFEREPADYSSDHAVERAA